MTLIISMHLYFSAFKTNIQTKHWKSWNDVPLSYVWYYRVIELFIYIFYESNPSNMLSTNDTGLESQSMQYRQLFNMRCCWYTRCKLIFFMQCTTDNCKQISEWSIHICCNVNHRFFLILTTTFRIEHPPLFLSTTVHLIFNAYTRNISRCPLLHDVKLAIAKASRNSLLTFSKVYSDFTSEYLLAIWWVYFL